MSVLTVSQVAALTGVTEATLRVWERRYKVVEPARSPGGYRLYDDTQVALLREMAALVDAGVPASRAAATLSGATVGAPAATPAALADAELAPDAFVAAAASLDPVGLKDVLDRAWRAGPIEQVVDDWLLPQLGLLGDAWASGRISVAQEHFASAGIMRALSAEFEHADPAAGDTHAVREPVLVGLPSGAHHEIALLGFAVCLRRLGTNVVYLGPDLPAESWVKAATLLRPRAAVVGVTDLTQIGPAQEVVELLADVTPPVSVWVGGSERARIVGAHPLPDRVADAAGILHRALLAGTP